MKTRTAQLAGIASTVAVASIAVAGCGGGSSSSAASSLTTSSSPAPSMSTGQPSGADRSPLPSGTPSTTTSGNGSTTGTPRCTVANLQITIGDGNADMQGSHVALRFKNTGSSACELTGAPGVSYVTGSTGTQVGSPATRIKGFTPVTIAPGATASAGLFMSSAPTKTPSCQTISVRGLRVYPPDSTEAAFVPTTQTACKAPMNGPFLKVGPIQPGADNADV